MVGAYHIPTDERRLLMSDVVDRITEVLRTNRYSPLLSCCRNADEHESHVAERVAAEFPGLAALARLRQLHHMVVTQTPDDSWECCDCCGADWPCPTIQIVGAGG